VECRRLLPEGDGRREVRWHSNPFAEEIHGDDTQAWRCGECVHEAAMDI
jgi:hypothetical protein